MRSFSKNKPILVTLTLLGVILTVVLVTWLNLSWRPDVAPIPPDSGFYAYIGKAILHGQVLYRDIFDDKPPIGYYLNALMLAIFGQTTWGLWWSGIVWISACILLFFLVVKKLFGWLTAAATGALFLLALMNKQVFQGGNMMEVYALAPQIGIIGITTLYFNRPQKSWLSILVGVLTAVCYMIKQPTIILGFASILVIALHSLTQRKISETIKHGLRFVLGFMGTAALVAVYWLAIGALGYFIDGAILQGFSFAGSGQVSLRDGFFYALTKVVPALFIGRLYLTALLIGGIFAIEKLYQHWLKPVLKARPSVLEWLLVAILFIFPLVAHWLWPGAYVGKFWLISIIALGIFILIKFYRLPLKSPAHQVFTPMEWTWMIALVALPFEVLMASLGGRYFGHYFITMIPSVILAIAYPVWRMISVSSEVIKSKSNLIFTVAYGAPLILAIGLGASLTIRAVPASDYTNNLIAIFQNRSTANELEQYIIQTTQPSDEVLVWHIHTRINFITDRKAPGRILYPLNLFIPPTEGNTRLKEFVDDIEANPPELIVVQKVSSISLPFVDQPIDQECQAYCTVEFVQALEIPQIRQQWIRFREFFIAHYALDNSIYDWNIYRRIH